MALILNEEQQMLRDSARSFLQERAPVSHLRNLRDEGNGPCLELWQEMVEMGWPATLIPEQYGGLDYGFAGLGIVLEESGRTLTPSALLSTALLGPAALAIAGSEAQREAILPGIVEGQRLLTLACDEGAQHDPGRVETSAKASSQGFVLSGHKTAVLDGQVADTLIVSASTGDAVSLFLVPVASEGVQVQPYPVLDTHIAAKVYFDSVELPADSLLGTSSGGLAVLDQILDAARIGASAELLGIAQEAFERTLEYLKERKQFGVAIGSFQALQHRAALLFGEIELCKSLVLKALQELDKRSDPNPELASLVKAKVGQTALLATTEAVQMHGGIGMTDDFDIGFYLKRCRILEALYGDHNFHLDRFASSRGY